LHSNSNVLPLNFILNILLKWYILYGYILQNTQIQSPEELFQGPHCPQDVPCHGSTLDSTCSGGPDWSLKDPGPGWSLTTITPNGEFDYCLHVTDEMTTSQRA
jgi:hypothetical protein